MKKIKSTITYRVPSWNFCNVDRIDITGVVPKETCRFCIKTKDGYRCALYDAALTADNKLINKTDDCCRATAGFASSIDDAPPVPTVSPLELMKQTIDLYAKTVNDLLKQGYPRPVAENVARKHLLGE